MNVNAIPLELRARNQWVTWTYVSVPGKPKPTKQPRRALAPHVPASVTTPKTWATFDQAVAALDHPEVDGIGYVFSPDDPYLGIDLDDGVSAADQAAIMLALDSYAETSVSSAGVHVIVRASLNGHGRNRKGPFEVYDHDRYFTFTGNHVRGTPTTIEDRQEQLEQVLSHFLPKAEPVEPISVRAPIPVDPDGVMEVSEAIREPTLPSRPWRGVSERPTTCATYYSALSAAT